MGFTESSKEDKRKNTGGVSCSVDNGTDALAAKMELGVLVKTTTCMHASVSSEEFQSAKHGDVGKQPVVRRPVRRSTRRCVVAGGMSRSPHGVRWLFVSCPGSCGSKIIRSI
jgi:hypothetical protein